MMVTNFSLQSSPLSQTSNGNNYYSLKIFNYIKLICISEQSGLNQTDQVSNKGMQQNLYISFSAPRSDHNAIADFTIIFATSLHQHFSAFFSKT